MTGKGGTGKTAICVGLARTLARRGRRVLLLEVDAPRPNLPSYFGGKSTYEPRVLAPRIEGGNIDFVNCLRSYVESVVPVRRVVGVVLRNKVVKLFLSATPGARELVLLSRIWEHSYDPRWDHIVVDLPASGHAVALFHTPELAQGTFARGPVRTRAEEVHERFSDPAVCTLLFAALPGEMPINETIETRQRILEIGLPHVGGFLLNRYPDELFTDKDNELLDRLVARSDDAPPNVAHAAETAWVVRREQRIASEGLVRLNEAFGSEASFTLPVIPGTHDQVAESISLVFGVFVQ